MYAAEKLEDQIDVLVDKHYPHLQNFLIRLCMVPKSWKRSGRVVLAQARASSVRERVLFGIHGWIEIAEEIWEADPPVLSLELQEAILDHELSHFEVKETPVEDVLKLVTVPHDIEDFLAVIQRHGLYRDELIELGIVLQGQLLGVVEAVEKSEQGGD